MHIGQTLKKVMKERNVTPGEMADHCGVSRGAVSNWFATGRITKENLVKACGLLQITVEALVDGGLGDRAAKPLEPLKPVMDGAVGMLTLMSIFSRLPDVQRRKVIDFALDQEKSMPKHHGSAIPPNLNPDVPAPKRRRTPKQDKGAPSNQPISGSSGAQQRKGRK